MAYDSNCRAIVLSANGKHFTAGLDLMDAMKFGQEVAEFEDVARKANYFEQKIKAYQVRTESHSLNHRSSNLLKFTMNSEFHFFVGKMPKTRYSGHTFGMRWSWSKFDCCS